MSESEIIAIANQKGGVAKTTSTFNIGAELAQRGNKVLMIDLDAQASLTICSGLEPYDYEANICSVMAEQANIQDCKVTVRNNLDIVTSDIGLSGLEMQLINATMRELILKNALTKVIDDYDYILIDCPPQLSILTINAFSSATKVLIPCKTDYLSYRGIDNLIDTIKMIKEKVNPDLQILGIIATFFKSNTTDDKDVLSYLKEKYNVIATVKDLTIVKKGVYDGKAAFEIDVKSSVAVEYSKVCDYITTLKGEK